MTAYNKKNTNVIYRYLVSQGRDVKAYGLDVSAPTGQMSMTLPESSDINIFST